MKTDHCLWWKSRYHRTDVKNRNTNWSQLNRTNIVCKKWRSGVFLHPIMKHTCQHLCPLEEVFSADLNGLLGWAGGTSRTSHLVPLHVLCNWHWRLHEEKKDRSRKEAREGKKKQLRFLYWQLTFTLCPPIFFVCVLIGFILVFWYNAWTPCYKKEIDNTLKFVSLAGNFSQLVSIETGNKDTTSMTTEVTKFAQQHIVAQLLKIISGCLSAGLFLGQALWFPGGYQATSQDPWKSLHSAKK